MSYFRLDVIPIRCQRGGMTQANERTATLSELVAEEIRALMARRRVSGRQLAAQLQVSPSWVSYRLTGTQPIDVNDLLLIAHALEVGVHDLLPSPEAAAAAKAPTPAPSTRRRGKEGGITAAYQSGPEAVLLHRVRPRDTRPVGQPGLTGIRRSALLPRRGRP